ncbi:MAG: helix-turn-helix domain-containing protein [Phycisphaerales bacterium]|nr:helix-turn-helix domain-containing protein [Phycisphaerales bacterium]
MAKMFYTLEEAAEKLGKSAGDVQKMAASGQLQEFRDRDRLMFKKEQVDLLVGGHDEDALHLGDELEPLSLSSSGSGSGMGLDSGHKEATGISIFDPDDTEHADPSAQTQVTSSGLDAGFELDSASSGSGLLDLTKEADDTSLGADLLEDVYGQDTMGATSPTGESGITDSPAALFEGAESETETAGAGSGAVTMVPMLAEAYDGTWSGIGGGLALGMTIALAFAIAVVLFAMTGSLEPVRSIVTGQFWAVVGGMAGVCVIFAVIGMVVGKKS